MGILLPNNNIWSHANWVSRAFFSDSLEVIGNRRSFAEIKKDIEECIKNYSHTLSDEKIDREKLESLQNLVGDVLTMNKLRGPAAFTNNEGLSYMRKTTSSK